MLKIDGVSEPAGRGDTRRSLEFTRPYALTLLAALKLFSIGWIRPHGRAQIVQFAGILGYSHGQREAPLLPVIDVQALVPDCSVVRLCAMDAVDGNVSDRELITIARLVRSLHTERIFEIGTFDGRTTLNLAANASDDSEVHTLDLPASQLGSVALPLSRDDVRYAEKEASGARFRNTAFESKIIQHYGDSASFDFSEFEKGFDFVFVDGAHSYPYVINDSLRALSLLRDSGGMIVWHDYGRWDGVTRALNDLQKLRIEFSQLKAVKGTTLALLRLESR